MPQIIELALLPEEAAKDESIVEHLRVRYPELASWQLLRRSIDARGRKVVVRLQIEVFLKQDPPPPPMQPLLERFVALGANSPEVLIIGAGPAGYFAALRLLEQGIKPIVLERGKDVRSRRRDLKAIQQQGLVNPHSNYCFGEGGAGTYSDGKLYTRSHKRGSIEHVLRLLVEHGAKADILSDAHPHIGSNKLPKVVEALRETILNKGGEIHFDTFVTDFIIHQQRILGVETEDGRSFKASALILATGHSARDIFELFERRNILIEAKPFALGVRIEHPQALIDEMQYGQKERDPYLPASSYGLVCQAEERGVFSFCMCPGGLIVPAATAPEELVVNGMSMSRRDSPFANSGLVVELRLDDLPATGPKQAAALRGLAFQQSLERAFFKAGDGSQKAPAQRLTDFVQNRLSKDLGPSSYIPGLYAARLDQLLPSFISKRLQWGLKQFGQKKKGFFTQEAQLIGLESRTSSPVRIPRDKIHYMHPEISGLFPCGEGAGYAGGIVSAAMDGENVADKVAAWLVD